MAGIVEKCHSCLSVTSKGKQVHGSFLFFLPFFHLSNLPQGNDHNLRNMITIKEVSYSRGIFSGSVNSFFL